MGKWVKRISIIWAFIFITAAIFPADAVAHPLLTNSEPEEGEMVLDPPKEVRLSFTEPLYAEYSRIWVAESQRERLNISSGAVDPENPYMLVTTIDKPLAEGVYTVYWRAVSPTDGHLVTGYYQFAIGEEILVLEAGGQAEASTSENLVMPFLSVLIRWVNLAIALTATGFWFFWWSVLNRNENLHSRVYRIIFHMGWALAAVHCGRGFLTIMIWSGSEADYLLRVIVDGILGLSATQFGLIWLLQLLVLIFSLVISRLGLSWKGMLPAGLWLYLWLQAWTSHAAVLEGFLPAVNDAIHLTAAAIWVGVIFGLVWIIPFLVKDKFFPMPIARIVRRASYWGIASMIILAISGMYSAGYWIAGPESLLLTAWSQLLFVKLILVSAAMILGVINSWVAVKGRHHHSMPLKDRKVSLQITEMLVRIEFIIMALILVAASLLGEIPTPTERLAISATTFISAEPDGNKAIQPPRANITILKEEGKGLTRQYTVQILDRITDQPVVGAYVEISAQMVNGAKGMAVGSLSPREQIGTYGGEMRFPASGLWRVMIEIADPIQGLNVWEERIGTIGGNKQEGGSLKNE